EPPRHGADLGLGQVAQREARVPQLVLAQPVEEVRLVLVLVGGAAEARATRAVAVDPPVTARVVARRDGIALVLAARATHEGPELHGRVAVHARRWRPAV